MSFNPVLSQHSEMQDVVGIVVSRTSSKDTLMIIRRTVRVRSLGLWIEIVHAMVRESEQNVSQKVSLATPIWYCGAYKNSVYQWCLLTWCGVGQDGFE